VLLLHHTGKYNEGYSPSGAYKGRGASAFGALSRLVLTLDNAKLSKGKVRLKCAKSKGLEFPPSIMQLDQTSRWFSVSSIENTEGFVKDNGEYFEVIEFVSKRLKPIKRKNILAHFKGKISRANIDRHLRDAVRNGDLIKPDIGFYSAPRNPNSELPLAK
jgi:hypothetical protein